MRTQALLLTLLLFLVSCGNPQRGKIAAEEKIFSPQQMEVQITNQSISCSDKEFCPEGVARMFSINFQKNSKSSWCTAFLIAPDVVMTNSHCVPPMKGGLKETCRGLYFAFPTPSGNSHTAQCEEILWRDKRIKDENSYQFGFNDFALIRLNQNIPLTPLKFKTGPLTNGTSVYPVVVDHIDAYVAKVTKLECSVKKVNRMGVAQLKDCPIIGGNSGAPIMDEEQNVVGIIFASSNPDIRKATDGLDLRKKATSTGLAFTADQIIKTLGSRLP